MRKIALFFAFYVLLAYLSEATPLLNPEPFLVDGQKLGQYMSLKSLGTAGFKMDRPRTGYPYELWRKGSTELVISNCQIVNIKGIAVSFKGKRAFRIGDKLSKAREDVVAAGMRVDSYVEGTVLLCSSPHKKKYTVGLGIQAKGDRIIKIDARFQRTDFIKERFW